MPAKKATKKSGSQKLAAKRTAGAPIGALARALATIQKSGLINDIHIKGTPIPDIIRGTITAKTAAQAGSALSVLTKIPNIQYKPVKLFPKGIPAINEIVLQIDGKLNR